MLCCHPARAYFQSTFLNENIPSIYQSGAYNANLSISQRSKHQTHSVKTFHYTIHDRYA